MHRVTLYERQRMFKEGVHFFCGSVDGASGTAAALGCEEGAAGVFAGAAAGALSPLKFANWTTLALSSTMTASVWPSGTSCNRVTQNAI